jgi:hypothetical protein
MWMSYLCCSLSHVLPYLFYCFYLHVRSWNAGLSLKLVQPPLTGGHENLNVGDQSQAVCSRKVLENQSSVKKPTPNVPSNSSKPTSVLRKVPVRELRNVKAKPSECPNTSAPLKKTAVQFECLVSSDNLEQRVVEIVLNLDSAETHVSKGNTPLTSVFRTFSV